MVTFTVTDAGTGEARTIAFDEEKNGVAIRLEGCHTVDGDNGVIFVEFYNGEPKVHVWTDKNSSEVTTISLKGTM